MDCDKRYTDILWIIDVHGSAVLSCDTARRLDTAFQSVITISQDVERASGDEGETIQKYGFFIRQPQMLVLAEGFS